MSIVRTFVCFELPDEAKNKISQVQEELKTLGSGVRWVNPQGIHLTLKFLGEVEEKKLPAIADAVKAAADNCEPMAIEVGESGVFPNYTIPRVLWIGAREPTGMLEQCRDTVSKQLAKLGFRIEKKPFTPHMTIGRVKRKDGFDDILDHFAGLQVEPCYFIASEMVIMKSELKPSGAEYTPLYQINI